MPQDVGGKSTHVTLRIAPGERALMLDAMRHLGMTSMSDFVRHAIVKVSEEYLGTPGASERLAAAEAVQEALYASEPPPIVPTLADVFGVPLFSPQPTSTVSRVEAVGLNDDMGDWL